jgi:hypothetical protein
MRANDCQQMEATGGPAIQKAKDDAMKFAKDGEELIKKGQSEKELLKKILVPTADFHKTGLRAAISAVKPMMADIDGLVAEYAEKINLDLPMAEVRAEREGQAVQSGCWICMLTMRGAFL